MRILAAAAVLAGCLCSAAGAQAPAASPAIPGPAGVATLSAFVGQWTCVAPQSASASLWTITYEEDGQALHIAIAGPSVAGHALHRDVFVVAHAPANDLYAFGLGSRGWEFGRSAAFDGKTLSFASLQSADGRPVTQTLELETTQSFSSKIESALPSGATVSSTESCTKA